MKLHPFLSSAVPHSPRDRLTRLVLITWLAILLVIIPLPV